MGHARNLPEETPLPKSSVAGAKRSAIRASRLYGVRVALPGRLMSIARAPTSNMMRKRR